MPEKTVPEKTAANYAVAEIRKRLNALADVYRVTLTVEMVEVYVDALRDLTELEVQIAFSEVVRHGKFFPRPAEILDSLAKLKECEPQKTSNFSNVCSSCDGTRFVMVPNPKEPGYQVAARCPKCSLVLEQNA